MSTQTREATVRTYGGWRPRRGIGLFGLGSGATLTLVIIGLVLVVTAGISLDVFLILVGPCLLLAALALIRPRGVPIGHLLLQRVRWWWGSMRGYTSYRAGIIVDHPRAWQLPGVLAPTQLISAEDGYGGHYGVVVDRRTGMLTATLMCAATSTWLANHDDAEQWVANWGGWLAGLGHIPAVQWVNVTIDTAPDPGSTLADYVQSRIDPRAPDSAKQLMGELVQRSPSAAADVRTLVSITCDPRALPNRPSTLEGSVAELSRTLHGMQSRLGTCGVAVLGRATAAEVAGIVRGAFDPAARGDIKRLLHTPELAESLLTWADAGPVGAEEFRNHYQHDSGSSISWAWDEAPRQRVHSGVLSGLMAPSRYPKRVSLLYMPFSAGDAARQLEQEVNATAFRAEFNRRQRRDPTARDQADAQRARSQAEEEAHGAGVCLMGVYVTVTAATPPELDTAAAEITDRAEGGKIRLRRMYFSQAAGFAATLPCGICLPALSRRWPH